MKVAVIGAGLSGLGCAKILQQAGLEITVFEKSRGLGGRMSTRRTESWQCDHGAQYFTARSAQFRDEVDSWIRAGAAAEWQATIISIGERPADLPDARKSETRRFVGTPGMSAPARFMAQGLNIKSQCRVQTLQRRGGGWLLGYQSANGATETAQFDWVVCAMPAPQSSELLSSSAPDVSAAIQRFGMQPCWAVMLACDNPLEASFDAAFVNEGALSWIARDTSKPSRKGAECWLLHASEQWSLDNLELTAEQATTNLLAEFARLTGIELNAFNVTQTSAHRWRYARNGDAPDAPVSRLESGLKLGICGDWLNGGRVEGAWQSGRHLAQSILNCATCHHPNPDR
ncbi:NAD(P)/FAD-dependent oxidoreductase [Pseudohongiella spirulinae]|uniref:FAD dependent oxidoreductase n=1 Tax=Pseudohongiella spirulinae TaxID=1249552 RepID=A0A0S2KB02_9GAMM|nr:FAD-dependent oxidoreductase [Pseudohongiella spirulinae]ALO45267.1 FAD dependent oxidoreductase [Pseudohongiella spirulinae]